ncbi:tellurite resistance TerB family protein [Verminephrobacter aporrectodeae]|uniref:Tellurite resistance protein TerB n=1 Tax=Verminephrobacter aporrectodeae subsp. tuberculatae TaxID=1110392 RepID=A0ABT3KS23_9BURK|nr:hypothetical protein [Verminephrobacter aporrectodeae]MCW5219929.1 hypothetical protein [Verminephrobacter aporrectodeae subsp. tuberculatae]MCW5256078.1 hypothetical protein [Verminephrobacter aporrectodeae subsp. tuberculatae]MCW5289217.1 hypothetical protein [Verminephrobacter aporrectodeae subsp. tuberculatae]MCW5321119.1 hypothetical protein [Verminephrobacter aporrectodeae subsp. tuberculatae]MCW8164827.1 hypothetical protein [Verminephrobacter aporrectodeae subsp. tuberculatae]
MNLNIRLSPAQTTALTAAMLAVAHVDGVHPAEIQLIRQFYEGGREGDMPAFADVQDAHLRAVPLLQQLSFDPEFAEALVGLCLMVGYSDGSLTDPEKDTALGLARSYGVSTAQFDEQLQIVRDSLLCSLASLPDTASVAALAKEL